MNKRKIVIMVMFWLSIPMFTNAQGGQWSKSDSSFVPWPNLREADMVYRKRIWRIIDLREKNNKVMTWPKNAFPDLILRFARNGTLPVYSSSDSMHTALSIEDVMKQTSYESVIEVLDSEALGGRPVTDFAPDEIPTIVQNVKIARRWEDIKQLRVMEEWIFDKNHGKMLVRIISIEPMVDVLVNGNNIGVTEPMFSIKYPELRTLMVKEKVFNRMNDAMQLSYDDFLEQRLFSSYIIKESNAYDYFIKGLPEFEHDNLAALLEADRIK